MAEPFPRILAADAQVRRSGRRLDPAETLVRDLTAETAASTGTALQRIGCLVEMLDRPVPQAAQFDNMNILQLNPPSGGSVTVLNEIIDANGNPKPPLATIEFPVPEEIFPENPLFNVVTVPPDRKRRNAYVQNANFMVQRQLS